MGLYKGLYREYMGFIYISIGVIWGLYGVIYG